MGPFWLTPGGRERTSAVVLADAELAVVVEEAEEGWLRTELAAEDKGAVPHFPRTHPPTRWPMFSVLGRGVSCSLSTDLYVDEAHEDGAVPVWTLVLAATDERREYDVAVRWLSCSDIVLAVMLVSDMTGGVETRRALGETMRLGLRDVKAEGPRSCEGR